MKTKRQLVLEFGRSEKARNRGSKLGRPLLGMRVPHRARAELGKNTAVHVTLKVRGHVPNLRARDRFAVVRTALGKFRVGVGFRLVQWCVMGNHMHLICEADSAGALSGGIRAIAHSVSRRLSALNVARFGEVLSTRGGVAFTKLRGWLGRVFVDRYHSHVLATPTEMVRAIRYVLGNATHHGFAVAGDVRFTSSEAGAPRMAAHGYLLGRSLSACTA